MCTGVVYKYYPCEPYLSVFVEMERRLLLFDFDIPFMFLFCMVCLHLIDLSVCISLVCNINHAYFIYHCGLSCDLNVPYPRYHKVIPLPLLVEDVPKLGALGR